MAYETGTTTGAADLLAKLETFATANGWTVDDSSSPATNKMALHKGSNYISFRYDSADTTGEQQVGIYHALGHIPGNLPGAHTDDSGSGFNTSSSVAEASIKGERHVDLGLDGSGLQNTYYFFEQDASPAYIHVVIVRTDGRHQHFGFGELVKFGTWTGGEYAYGQHIGYPTVTPLGNVRLCCLLDGRTDANSSATSSNMNPKQLPTLHIEGFPDEDASSKWGQICGAKGSDFDADTAGNPRFAIQGGYRGGPVVRSLGAFPVGRTNGFTNLIPIDLFAVHNGSTPKRLYYIGYMPDVRGISLDGLVPGEEITVGTETWVVFPSLTKTQALGGTDEHFSLYQGIAYRKETA